MVVLWVDWETLPRIFFADWLDFFPDRRVHLIYGVASIPLPLESVPSSIDINWQPNILILWQNSPKWVFLNTLTTTDDFGLWLSENAL
jgi:hypothetical protein